MIFTIYGKNITSWVGAQNQTYAYQEYNVFNIFSGNTMKNLQYVISLLVLILNTIHFAKAVEFTVTLTNSTGEFTSPRYPGNYYKDDYAVYNIRTQPGTYIRLRWKVFEVWDQAPDCNKVYVRIWLG